MTTIELGRQDFCLVKVTDTSNEPGDPPSPPPGPLTFSTDGPGVFDPDACELEESGPNEAQCLLFYRPTAYGTGAHRIAAHFFGNSHHEPADGSITINVLRPTETYLTCLPLAVHVGEATSCRVKVLDTSGEMVAATGAVKFTSNGPGDFSGGGECALAQAAPSESLCQSVIEFVPSEEGLGGQLIRSEYRGDGGHESSATINALAVLPEVPPTATTTSLRCEPETVAVGHPVSCEATVADTSPGFPPITEPIAFSSEGPGKFSAESCLPEPIGADESGCEVEYTPEALDPTEQHLSAQFPGDARHEPSGDSATLGVVPAEVRYAAPGGSGADPCADPQLPCSLFEAAARSAPGTTIASGDEVVVEPGHFKASSGDLGPAGSVETAAGVAVHGEPGKPRPQIELDGSSSTFTLGARASLSYVALSGGASGFVLGRGASADAVIARASGEAATACMGVDGSIRDSVCLATGSRAIGVGGQFSAAPTQQNLALRNVTALAVGANTAGLELSISGSEAVVNAKAVIAEAEGSGSHDVLAKAGTGAVVEIKLDHSDFDSAATSGPGIAATSLPGESESITQAPLFEPDGYHQSAASPTIDRGEADALSGSTDLDGQSRLLGSAVDIGADEAGRSTAAGLACAPARPLVGRASTCTFSIADSDSGQKGTPTGAVFFTASGQGAFSAGSCELAAVPQGAPTSCQVQFTPGVSGAQVVEALYAGDGDYAPAGDSFNLRAIDPTATTVSCAPSPSAVGANAVCTATVRDTAPSGATRPGERVRFSSDPSAGAFGGSGTCTLVAAGAGQASCAVVYVPGQVGSGSHPITAGYDGDSGHDTSSGETAIAITDPTATSLNCAPAQLILGAVAQAVACTVEVTDTASAAAIPRGEVELSSDGPGALSTPSCGLDAGGACEFTYTPSAVGSGSHELSAAYAGEPTHEASQATAQVKVFVAPVPPAPPPGPPPPVAAPPAAQPAPATTIRKVRTLPTFAVFTFGSDQSPVSFECKLDKLAFRPCGSTFNTKTLKTRKVGKGNRRKLVPAFKLRNGVHILQVRATNAAGQADPTPARFRWRVGKVIKRKKH